MLMELKYIGWNGEIWRYTNEESVKGQNVKESENYVRSIIEVPGLTNCRSL